MSKADRAEAKNTAAMTLSEAVPPSKWVSLKKQRQKSEETRRLQLRQRSTNKIDKQEGRRKPYEADCDGTGLARNRQVNSHEPAKRSGGGPVRG